VTGRYALPYRKENRRQVGIIPKSFPGPQKIRLADKICQIFATFANPLRWSQAEKWPIFEFAKKVAN